MPEQAPQKPPVTKPAEPAHNENLSNKDLSQEIERIVERQPLDRVKCVRVFGDYYRCNWWSRTGVVRGRQDYDWSDIIMDVVRKSSFLSATIQAGELVLKEIRPVVDPLQGPAGDPR